ncbi:deoxycytidylate deaminase [Mycobacteroides abscessus]|uniref:deoxycytidylate deaminase n=1 Tax=Mycobacteroides abscessus TaxID=36809 RepID=UPI0009AB5208|nr:deaminase [Mycobacteroides abscessus]
MSNCRPSWDEYFLNIATAVAERSDCDRSKVGAVVVKDRRIRGAGYNGSPAGMPGCGSCPRRLASVSPGETSYDDGPGRCVAVHAEANALLYCDREDLVGATLYVTREPCYGCEKLITASGVERVVTPEPDLVVTCNRWLQGGPPGFPERTYIDMGYTTDEWWEILEASH